MNFKVEGLWFTEYLHAITVAQRKAEELGRVVDVVAANRDWIATMKPPQVRP